MISGTGPALKAAAGADVAGQFEDVLQTTGLKPTTAPLLPRGACIVPDGLSGRSYAIQPQVHQIMASSLWRDVLVQVEKVGWVILGLQGGQAVVVVPVGRLDAVLSLIHQEVHIGRTQRVRVNG